MQRNDGYGAGEPRETAESGHREQRWQNRRDGVVERIHAAFAPGRDAHLLLQFSSRRMRYSEKKLPACSSSSMSGTGLL